MHTSLVIGTVVSVVVLTVGMITAFVLQANAQPSPPQQQVDAFSLAGKACRIPLEQLESRMKTEAACAAR
jgi:uncharacterized protein (DUF849 family)